MRYVCHTECRCSDDRRNFVFHSFFSGCFGRNFICKIISFRQKNETDALFASGEHGVKPSSSVRWDELTRAYIWFHFDMSLSMNKCFACKLNFCTLFVSLPRSSCFISRTQFFIIKFSMFVSRIRHGMESEREQQQQQRKTRRNCGTKSKKKKCRWSRPNMLCK